ncbi:GAF domain-containing protein [Candidatus Bathyarchaeota archaeon]|jgi:PAS domain S-box-containing protein|nr:GAF domain-containing protein [Candidatus Bathyarchaeota archaeon]MBT4320141.1 GAF domain-containing protein [Candidatus Bathyarchaeota archaeon]MBT4424805.1 GAF domain-containing protein [Candidatus Bathyarchaeota archaeon]MBT6603971.1 GAF domain-containing protein [Candidatus Bathyarchaeota archaeon]MBT7188018.1 GAF domain-containing protein [Candidatus Bathyarchaeota archaeon]
MVETNDIFENIIKNTADGIVLAKDNIILFANQAAADIYGSGDPKEMVGSNIFDYVDESEHGRIKELKKNPLDSEQFKTPFYIKGYYTTGEQGIFEITSKGIPFMEGEVSLNTIRDVTKRIKWEDRINALHHSTASLGGATSQDAMIVIVLNALKEILGMDYASVGFVENEYLVFKRQLGVSTVDRLPLSGEGLTIKAIKNATTQIVGDLRVDDDYISSRPEGVPESLSELDVPIIVDGRAIAVINIEKQEINAFTDEETQMVEILADHFANSLDRLMQDRAMRTLREAHLMEMVGGIDKICEQVQGDLKGPIQSIRNASFVLRHNPDLSSEVVDNIDNSIEMIMNTLEEMKEITNPTEPVKTLTDIYGTIRAAIELSRIPEHIKLVTEMEGGFLALYLDQEKIKRAFYNILRNSIEAIPEEGVITVRLDSTDGFVDVTITDTGSGIPYEIKEQLFQPFFSTKASSLGLGLSFCKLAIESNGGSIDIDSVVDEGTKVTIKLPK